MVAIRAIPTTYRGIRFRSTLEANWAATFDRWGMDWSYEPEAVLIDDEPYLCDFYLPDQRVWAEVKGPHDERIEKAYALQKALGSGWGDSHDPFVVILRPPGSGDRAMWESAGRECGTDIVITRCPKCKKTCFMNFSGLWGCRQLCGTGGKFWNERGGDIWWPGELRFARAPRPLGISR